MSGFFVALSSIDDVKHFVDAASRCPCEVDVLSGRYVINAKSIMGLFSLDLSQPVQVEVHGTDAQRGAFQADVAAFRVDAGQ
ncbi:MULTISPECIES: HPr family phosphocarrier protein [Lawsonibacter]|uniref:HPr family phosphocarrier protein n=1 Tax=Lawsonibacter hominis TaxID=2763053 RepID=A0A8J6JHY7_9FIRM|nr:MULTISPECIES: HPr family phosphocarrier protein [Lawsonibacter]MBS1384536.1 HPr family phosphocarrier protein [Flavonifractor sp.]MDU2195026.1 HPr family phosphocarrier protein [Clostridiales bacterium]MDY2976994.1 HPr family phosphocarrier protein [Oscillospiraceae bacterium]MBC5734999.1 HPr family phosphocarrier protein [Lawsonibacter hominis]MCI6398281.1 HPr family phosphocarrier protein [Lawsonibacter sp.]